MTFRAVRKRGNARPYSQSRKKVRKRVVRNEVMQGHIVKVEKKVRKGKNRKILLARILKVEKKVKRSVVRI